VEKTQNTPAYLATSLSLDETETTMVVPLGYFAGGPAVSRYDGLGRHLWLLNSVAFHNET
jgi:hypothetical protein